MFLGTKITVQQNTQIGDTFYLHASLEPASSLHEWNSLEGVGVGLARPGRDPPTAAATCAFAVGEVDFLGCDAFVVHYLKRGLGLAIRETQGLPCARNTLQSSQNARQSLCCAFFSKTHNKGRTTDFCRFLHGKGLLPCVFCHKHGKDPLPCVKDGARQNKGANGGTEQTAWACLCRARPNKMHDKGWVFAVRFPLNARQTFS
jgi:hypothetical protein